MCPSTKLRVTVGRPYLQETVTFMTNSYSGGVLARALPEGLRYLSISAWLGSDRLVGFFEHVLVPETEVLEVCEVRPKFSQAVLVERQQ